LNARCCHYRLHDRDILVANRGRIFLHRENINLCRTQRIDIKEVDDCIWLVSFTHYGLGYFDLEQKTLQLLDNPIGPTCSPMS
jgi:hypothetical protein